MIAVFKYICRGMLNYKNGGNFFFCNSLFAAFLIERINDELLVSAVLISVRRNMHYWGLCVVFVFILHR